MNLGLFLGYVPGWQFNTMIYRYALLLVFSVSSFAASPVYKTVDENGKVAYSDQPSSAAKEVSTAPLLNTFEYPDLAQPAGTAPIAVAAEQFDYDFVAMTAPKQDETVRSNNGDVSIRGHLNPPLRPHHQAFLVLDGTITGLTSSTLSFELQAVDRGTHIVAINITDENGKTLRSTEPVTFHVQRAAAARKAPR